MQKSDTQTSGPVAPRQEKRANKKQIRQAAPEPWGFQEDLTEAEGRVLDAARTWAKAEKNPALRAELTAFELVKTCVFEVRSGGERWETIAADMPLTTAEVSAFEVVTAFWKRKTKEEKRRAKRWAKQEGQDKP